MRKKLKFHLKIKRKKPRSKQHGEAQKVLTAVAVDFEVSHPGKIEQQQQQ